MSLRAKRLFGSAAPLDDKRGYRVATNTLLSEGGHHYESFRAGKNKKEHEDQYETAKRWIMRQPAVSVPVGKRIGQTQ